MQLLTKLKMTYTCDPLFCAEFQLNQYKTLTLQVDRLKTDFRVNAMLAVCPAGIAASNYYYYYYYYHPFNSFSCRTAWVSWHQKGKPFRTLLEQEMVGWQWHQLDHMLIICTSLQTDNHATTSPLRFYRHDLPATQRTASKH